MRQLLYFFFTERIQVLHGELVGTNSPQARDLFIKGCSPSRALSSEAILFPVRKPSGISEDNDDRFSLVGSSRNPLVPHLGVSFVFP